MLGTNIEVSTQVTESLFLQEVYPTTEVFGNGLVSKNNNKIFNDLLNYFKNCILKANYC